MDRSGRCIFGAGRHFENGRHDDYSEEGLQQKSGTAKQKCLFEEKKCVKNVSSRGSVEGVGCLIIQYKDCDIVRVLSCCQESWIP